MKRPRHRQAVRPEGAGARDAAGSSDRPRAERMARLLNSTLLFGLLLVGASSFA
jgi:hypothetical protein